MCFIFRSHNWAEQCLKGIVRKFKSAIVVIGTTFCGLLDFVVFGKIPINFRDFLCKEKLSDSDTLIV